MTREQAITIIRKECLCVNRDCDIERSCGKCDLVMPSKEPILEAYKMAIKALEQEPILDKIKAEIKEWYWQSDKQVLAKDPCVVDAMIDLFIRTIDKYKVESEDK